MTAARTIEMKNKSTTTTSQEKHQREQINAWVDMTAAHSLRTIEMKNKSKKIDTTEQINVGQHTFSPQ